MPAMAKSEVHERVVLVTGSSRGIGAATARGLHEDGATVVLHGRTESQHLTNLAKELDAKFIVCDITDAASVDDSIASLLQEVPQLHALVNCAGNYTPVPFLEATDDQWLAELNLSLLGAVRVCRAVVPHMVAREYGRIVNITSIRGDVAFASARVMAYSAAKAGLANFTVALAKELAPHVSVNGVAPGMIETDFVKRWTDAVWEQARSALVGRVGQPEEIGAVAAFQASDRASYVNAQVITVDGGYGVANK